MRTDQPKIELLPLTVDQLDLLASYNLAAATQSIGIPAPPYLLDGQWIWRNFADLIRRDPKNAEWRTQYLVVAEHLGPRRIVGHVRLHYYADYEHYVDSEPSGEVHIGWATDPVERDNGFAQAGTRELIKLARANWLHTIVALIADDNAASQAVADRVGFVRDGFQNHRFGWPMQRWIYRLDQPRPSNF